MDWEGWIKRYVWDDQRTPHLVPVARLTRRQADHELFAYSVFLAFLATIGAVLASAGQMGGATAPLVTLYGFTVLCATAVLGWSRHPLAAAYLTAVPAVVLAHLLLFGFHARLGGLDQAVIVGVLLLWLLYGRRVLAIARAYPRMSEGDAVANPRQRWRAWEDRRGPGPDEPGQRDAAIGAEPGTGDPRQTGAGCEAPPPTDSADPSSCDRNPAEARPPFDGAGPGRRAGGAVSSPGDDPGRAGPER